MKRYHYYNVIFLLFISSFNAAHASGDLPGTNERIKAFIQVWGLVKYRSLNAAAGKFNADSMFLASIEKVKSADEKQWKTLITAVLTNNPGSPSLKPLAVNSKKVFTKNIDYAWIKDNIFPAGIQQQLLALTKTFNPGKEHWFISEPAKSSAGLPEQTYPDYTFDNEPMNLLALAKAWNAVAYLFPYRYVMDQKLEVTLQQLIPVFRGVKSRTDYEKSILMLETAIDDTHAAGFLDQLKTTTTIFDLKYYPPFTYKIDHDQIVVKEFLNDSLARANDLKVGDIITAINGVPVHDWLKQRATLLPASNQAVKYRLLETSNALAFSGVNSAELKLRVKRANQQLDLSLMLLVRKDKNVGTIVNKFFTQKYNETQLLKPYEDLPGNIALIRAGYFLDKYLPSDSGLTAFSQNLNQKKAIIFDMRKYPASPGLFYYYLPMALGKPAFKFARYYAADVGNPGAFALEDGVEVYLSKDIKTKMPLYQGKIVILTDENTQSMGEWFTMMLRQINKNTTVFGTQTAGADGDLKYLNLPGGYQFLFTGNGIFYPDGKETQRIGIIPDVLYQPSLQDLISQKDMQLEKSNEYLTHH